MLPSLLFERVRRYVVHIVRFRDFVKFYTVIDILFLSFFKQKEYAYHDDTITMYTMKDYAYHVCFCKNNHF